MTTASTSISFKRATADRTSFSSSGLRIWPVASMRSDTSSLCSREISGSNEPIIP